MHIFLLFAILVWYLTYRFRRQWRAAVVLALGVPLVPLILRTYFFIFTGHLFPESGVLLDLVSMTYSGALLLVGVFFALVPRERTVFPCRFCRYELIGNVTGRCPECGNDIPHATQVAIADELTHHPRHEPSEDDAQAAA